MKAEIKAPADGGKRYPVSNLADLEEAVRRVRQTVATVRLRRVRSDSLEARLRRAGAWEGFVELVEGGATAAEVLAWLKREWGIQSSLTAVRRLRRKLVGRRVAREILEEIERNEQLLNPLLNCLTLLRRLEERYQAHVRFEAELGLPMHEPALRILHAMLEANRLLLEIMDRMRLLDSAELEVRGVVAVHNQPIKEPEEVMRMVLAALERRVQG
ncbi:MAG TPA: hypothetical protein ENF46_01570 [Candidatus Acetothermia bacterium]|nr:hypothetical protein [Candidatus Acetothermia bacterium]